MLLHRHLQKLLGFVALAAIFAMTLVSAINGPTANEARVDEHASDRHAAKQQRFLTVGEWMEFDHNELRSSLAQDVADGSEGKGNQRTSTQLSLTRVNTLFSEIKESDLRFQPHALLNVHCAIDIVREGHAARFQGIIRSVTDEWIVLETVTPATKLTTMSDEYADIQRDFKHLKTAEHGQSNKTWVPRNSVVSITTVSDEHEESDQDDRKVFSFWIAGAR